MRRKSRGTETVKVGDGFKKKDDNSNGFHRVINTSKN